MNAPITATAAVVLTRHQGMLEQTCGGDYLFHNVAVIIFSIAMKMQPIIYAKNLFNVADVPTL